MSPKTTLLLVASLVGAVVADQTQEVYKKDDSTFVRGAPPKFRDASEFTTPSVDQVYVTIDGLPSYQHGFELVNPRYLNQRSSSQKASQKEELAKQGDFVKSILEANKASLDAKTSFSNIFRPSQPLASSLFENPSFKTDSSQDTRFGTLDLFGSGVPEESAVVKSDAGETTTHNVFQFHFPREQKGSSSQGDFLLDSRDFVGTSPKPAQRNDFSRLQSDISSNNGDRKQSFVFRERGTTPAFQGSSDFGRFGQASFSSERPSLTKTNQDRNPIGVGKPERNGGSRISPVSSRPSLAEPSLVPEISIPGKDKFGTRQRPGRIELHSSVIPGTSSFGFGAQIGDDEESKFISQVNQNTASFVSKNKQTNGFEELVPKGFEPFPSLSDQTSGFGVSQPPQDLPPVHGFVGSQSTNKRRKEPIQKTRRPIQNQAATEQRLPVLPPIPETRFTSPSNSRFPNPKSVPGEIDQQAVDQELEARKQAENAMYSFASSVSDTVNDSSQSRQEVRDGLKLKGMYSYSDGFFKRTVHYEADEGGYRVVKEESEPIGSGPQYDPNGEVYVNFQQSGSNLQYNTRGDQLRKNNRKPTKAVQTFDDYSEQQELPILNH
ncbi:hypothetical protein GE061_009607 [Apolygus lucorum]|uniref:Uncharacterized protein n=1 Tax=Apolygus lucorum TaxID=248454 RepID=A0A8S9Y110_APOLU|nr:hypothetical protein GE061_009607 [Apolygus lucorum]